MTIRLTVLYAAGEVARTGPATLEPPGVQQLAEGLVVAGVPPSRVAPDLAAGRLGEPQHRAPAVLLPPRSPTAMSCSARCPARRHRPDAAGLHAAATHDRRCLMAHYDNVRRDV